MRKITIEDVKFDEEPFCEHCLDMSPYTPMIDDGYVTWCLDCAMNHEDISKDVRKKIETKEVTIKISYHEERLRELNKKLTNLS